MPLLINFGTSIRKYLVCCYLSRMKSLLQLRKLRDGLLVCNMPFELGTITGYSGRPFDTEFFFKFSSFLNPGKVYRVDLNSSYLSSEKPTTKNCCGCTSTAKESRHLFIIISRIFRQSKLGFHPHKIEAHQVHYKSKDGTRVSMFLVHKQVHSFMCSNL